MGKFGQSMVSFAQLKMAETVGEGALDCTYLYKWGPVSRLPQSIN